MKSQKGFTLIELMVVIVIIGILSALAIPKMFGISAKAKMAEAPSVLANYETLQSAYVQETGDVGTFAAIGFTDPSNATMSPGYSKWWDYTPTLTAMVTAVLTAANGADIGMCTAGAMNLVTSYAIATDAATHSGVAVCLDYVPNFKP